MTVKTTGAEFKRYYHDTSAWPEGAWHEEGEITVDGEEFDRDKEVDDIPDSSCVTLAGGVVYLNERDIDGPSFETHFRRWLRKQTFRTVVVELPIDKLGPFGEALKAFGGKLV